MRTLRRPERRKLQQLPAIQKLEHGFPLILEQVVGASGPCHLALLQAHDVIGDTARLRQAV